MPELTPEQQAEVTKMLEAQRAATEGEFRKEFRSQLRKAIVAALVAGIFAGGGAAWAYIKNYASSGKIIDLLGGISAQKAVIAFEYEGGGLSKCPDGWTIYEPAMGRIIVGAGSRAGDGIKASDHAKWPKSIVQADGSIKTEMAELSVYDHGKSGGAETVALTKEQLPTHEHNVGEFIGGGSDQRIGAGPHTYVFPLGSITDRAVRTFNSAQTTGLLGRHHNNMPPYIALYFCKKD